MSYSEEHITRLARKHAIDSLGVDGAKQAGRDGTLDYYIAREGGMDYEKTPLALQRLFDMYYRQAIRMVTEGYPKALLHEALKEDGKVWIDLLDEHALSLVLEHFTKLKCKDGSEIPDETLRSLLRWKAEQEMEV